MWCRGCILPKKSLNKHVMKRQHNNLA
jgi:hypothetical protein